MPTGGEPYGPAVPQATALDAVHLVAEARRDALRARRLLDRRAPAPSTHRRRAGELLARASDSLRRSFDAPGVSPAAARYLVDVRDAVDSHLLAAGDIADDTFAVHHHRLLVCAAELLAARVDAAAIRRVG
jgi:hypothetical protein